MRKSETRTVVTAVGVRPIVALGEDGEGEAVVGVGVGVVGFWSGLGGGS